MARSREDKARFITSLRDGVEAMKSKGIKPPNRLLENFSPSNALMILSQRPDATNCAGFQTWRELGRTVRKGSKGIAILIPLTNDEDQENLRFSWRHVFDISDTEEIITDSPKREEVSK